MPWLVGDWQTEDGAVSEYWQPVSPNTLEGTGISRSSDQVSTEFLRIVRMGDEIFFIAKVTHNDFPVAFRMTDESTSDRLVFVNKTHDFPKRFVYERDGDYGLLVTVSDGAEGFDIRFLRQ